MRTSRAAPLFDLVRAHRITGNDIVDAQIAATCLLHGVSKILVTDCNFKRLDEIRVRGR